MAQTEIHPGTTLEEFFHEIFEKHEQNYDQTFIFHSYYNKKQKTSVHLIQLLYTNGLSQLFDYSEKIPEKEVIQPVQEIKLHGTSKKDDGNDIKVGLTVNHENPIFDYNYTNIFYITRKAQLVGFLVITKDEKFYNTNNWLIESEESCLFQDIAELDFSNVQLKRISEKAKKNNKTDNTDENNTFSKSSRIPAEIFNEIETTENGNGKDKHSATNGMEITHITKTLAHNSVLNTQEIFKRLDQTEKAKDLAETKKTEAEKLQIKTESSINVLEERLKHQNEIHEQEMTTLIQKHEDYKKNQEKKYFDLLQSYNAIKDYKLDEVFDDINKVKVNLNLITAPLKDENVIDYFKLINEKFFDEKSILHQLAVAHKNEEALKADIAKEQKKNTLLMMDNRAKDKNIKNLNDDITKILEDHESKIEEKDKVIETLDQERHEFEVNSEFLYEDITKKLQTMKEYDKTIEVLKQEKDQLQEEHNKEIKKYQEEHNKEIKKYQEREKDFEKTKENWKETRDSLQSQLNTNRLLEATEGLSATKERLIPSK